MNANPKESLDLRLLRWGGLALSLFVAGSLVTIGGAATEPAPAAAAVHAVRSHRDVPGQPCPTGEHIGRKPQSDHDGNETCPA
jgi:hypothetical protein